MQKIRVKNVHGLVIREGLWLRLQALAADAQDVKITNVTGVIILPDDATPQDVVQATVALAAMPLS